MSRKLTRLPFAAASVALALAAAACGNSTSSAHATPAASSSTAPATAATGSPAGGGSAGSGAISETGSTLLYPLFNEWAPAYHAKNPSVSITTQGTGSGTGISQAAAGAVDIGASDAYLPPAKTAKDPTLENIPLAISAQQINYNLPGVKNLKINGKLLSAIYQGRITRWNDPEIAAINPGITLPAMKIVPLHRSDGSGDTFLFTTYLSKSDPSGWGQKIGYNTSVNFPAVPGALGENGNGGMVSGCASTPGCVAYIGISFLSEATSKGLGEALAGNAAGQYLLPTPSTIHAEAASFTTVPTNGAISLIFGPAANAYPIINYEYAIVNTKQSPAKAQAVKAFLSWAINPADGNSASYLDKVKFQPLPPAAASVAQALIAKVGS